MIICIFPGPLEPGFPAFLTAFLAGSARLLHAAGGRLDGAAVPGGAKLGGGAAGETIGATAERRSGWKT